MKKILYYNWNENSGDDICKTFEKLGYKYKKISYELRNYNTDAVFEDYLKKIIIKDSYDVIFTFDFFPVISKVAQKSSVIYVSWIYDSPHYSLYSDEIYNLCNRIYFFDRSQLEYFKLKGLKNGFHQPLAVNIERLENRLGTEIEKTSYKYDVSFVGSLYEDNMYNKINYIPEYLGGYLDGII